jgi:hypothetical protein
MANVKLAGVAAVNSLVSCSMTGVPFTRFCGDPVDMDMDRGYALSHDCGACGWFSNVKVGAYNHGFSAGRSLLMYVCRQLWGTTSWWRLLLADLHCHFSNMQVICEGDIFCGIQCGPLLSQTLSQKNKTCTAPTYLRHCREVPLVLSELLPLNTTHQKPVHWALSQPLAKRLDSVDWQLQPLNTTINKRLPWVLSQPRDVQPELPPLNTTFQEPVPWALSQPLDGQPDLQPLDTIIQKHDVWALSQPFAVMPGLPPLNTTIYKRLPWSLKQPLDVMPELQPQNTT